jgi:phage FluMu gp28-like protein
MRTWKNDPVLFAERFFGWKAHDAQKRILRAKGQVITIAAGRRFGKSEAMAISALFYAFKHPQTIQFIIAPTYDQSMVIFETMLKFLSKSVLNTAIEKVKYSPYPILKFLHNSEIHARSADQHHNLRGRKAHRVILDEAAFIKDEAVYEVIEPMLADYNGQMIKISTPHGKNHFWETWVKGREGVPGYVSFQFPSTANPYISHEFLENKKREYGESSLRWRIEYMAEFVDEQELVFPWRVIESVIEDYKVPVQPAQGRKYYMGVDVAKYEDWTVIVVLDDTGRLVYFERFNRRPWGYITERVESVQRQYGASGYIDATGVGDPIWEALQQKGVYLEPFKFTSQTKRSLVDNLRGRLEEGMIRIPRIPELIDELRFFEYEIRPTGTVKLEARYGYHDDCVMALALAVWGLSKPRRAFSTRLDIL